MTETGNTVERNGCEPPMHAWIHAGVIPPDQSCGCMSFTYSDWLDEFFSERGMYVRLHSQASDEGKAQ